MIYVYRRSKAWDWSLNWLTAVHIVRIPVELVLFRLFLDGEIPKLMSFEGYNFDILMGISALLILLYKWRSGSLIQAQWLKIWNWAGIVFLSIIVVLAILSAPLPIQQLAFEQPNVAVLKFPFIYLPAFIVPLVYLSHFLALRELAK